MSYDLFARSEWIRTGNRLCITIRNIGVLAPFGCSNLLAKPLFNKSKVVLLVPLLCAYRNCIHEKWCNAKGRKINVENRVCIPVWDAMNNVNKYWRRNFILTEQISVSIPVNNVHLESFSSYQLLLGVWKPFADFIKERWLGTSSHYSRCWSLEAILVRSETTIARWEVLWPVLTQ